MNSSIEICRDHESLSSKAAMLIKKALVRKQGLLLCAAGGCSGADVVSILEKKRIVLTRCFIEVGGIRREDYPRRFTSMWLRFTLAGKGLTRAAAEQAVELSRTKYCSVLLSLNPDIEVKTEIVIEES